MKTIGLIGGMSWESTAEYYRIINRTVKARLAGWGGRRLPSSSQVVCFEYLEVVHVVEQSACLIHNVHVHADMLLYQDT